MLWCRHLIGQFGVLFSPSSGMRLSSVVVLVLFVFVRLSSHPMPWRRHCASPPLVSSPLCLLSFNTLHPIIVSLALFTPAPPPPPRLSRRRRPLLRSLPTLRLAILALGVAAADCVSTSHHCLPPPPGTSKLIF